MRSTRSSNNVEHEPRRNEYYYHHSNRSSQSHAESNGYGSNNSTEYRSKRSSSAVAPVSSSSSLIKRMKSSPNSVTTNNSTTNSVNNTKENSRDHPNLKHKSPALNSSLNIDPNECHQQSYSGYCLEEVQALEGESLVDNAKQAFDKFSETTRDLRKLVLEVLEVKKKNINQSKTNDDNDKKNKVYNSSKVKGLMHLMEMKSLNRVDKYILKEARQRFSSSKENVDKIHLQLQNLQYEVMHLQKEQKTCASFRSKDEALELVECSKFYLSDSVPEHLRDLIIVSSDKKSASVSKSATNEERHKLHLARLDWELQQRVSSEEELKLAEESRFRLEVEISAKRRTLAQFEPTLRNIIDASKPLVSHLNVPLQVYNTSNYLTPYLPQPLYVLYIQLCAYKGAFGFNYDVSTKGTVEEAQEYESKLKKENDGYFFNNYDDEDEKQQDDDDDDNEHRSKSKTRHYHQSSNENKDNLPNGDEMDISSESLNDNFAKKHSKLLQSHPIKVDLTLRFRHYQMLIIFTYYSKLGFAYDWAQRMAGIEFLNPDKQPIVSSAGIIRVKSSIAIDCLDKTVKAINCRFQARINLQEQIMDIQNKKFIDTTKFESLLDSNELYDDLNKALLKPKSSIKSFQRLSSELFLDEIDRFPSKKRQLVDYFDYESSEENELSHDIFDQNNFIFKLVISTDEESPEFSYTLDATIIIPHNYPQKWPFFILNFDYTLSESFNSYLEPTWLRTLEEHINVRLPLKVTQQAKKIEEAIHSTTLLLRQIYDMQCGLDVIVGARKQLVSKSSQSLEVYSGPKCVNSFTSMSIVQGRDHSLKFG